MDILIAAARKGSMQVVLDALKVGVPVDTTDRVRYVYVPLTSTISCTCLNQLNVHHSRASWPPNPSCNYTPMIGVCSVC